MDDLDRVLEEVERLDRCASRDWRQEGCKIRCGPNGSMLTKDAYGSPMFIAYDDASAAVYCRNAAPLLAAEVRNLRAELEEAHLTLAAEQGRQEGAPSERWRFRVVNGVGEWVAAVESTGGYQRVEPSRAWTGELVGWLLLTFDGLGHLVETTSYPTARAAMLAANAAVG